MCVCAHIYFFESNKGTQGHRLSFFTHIDLGEVSQGAAPYTTMDYELSQWHPSKKFM
eukprot:COSAG01_NODE_10251_length_2209_cov_8.560190_3_plen_57_part_00